MTQVRIGPDIKLDPQTVFLVATNPKIRVSMTPKAHRAVEHSRAVVEKMLIHKQIIYGLTTGFGKFKDVYINTEQSATLQRNLILSHSVGVGELLSREVVRASLLIRVHSLAQGYSGVRVELIEAALALLNADICPVVPSQGSVGASGDLAPLSHMGLTLIGEGDVFFRGVRMSSRDALKKARIAPVKLSAKEGLAWNNGTAVMLGTLSLSLERARRLADLADIGCALTLEALRGVRAAFRPEVHARRPHQGQLVSAKNILQLVRGSKLIDSVPNRIQDAYSIRCAPQVHGASRETIRFVESIVMTELGSVTDNPIILPQTGEAISGGNFHGEPLAQAADALAIAVAELANISERRTAKLLDTSTNEGLPMFLIPTDKAGLHSGLMMPQYTAAALVSENKVLSHPASVDSIPTSANQEDHVSMGSIAARKALKVIENAENVLAIEFLTALQAVDFLDVRKMGTHTKRAYAHIRRKVSFVSEDRILSGDISSIREMITGDSFAKSILA